MRALESAFELASVRRDGYVEPHHWLAQILQQPDSDLVRILGAFGIDPRPVAKDLTARARPAAAGRLGPARLLARTST